MLPPIFSRDHPNKFLEFDGLRIVRYFPRQLAKISFSRLTKLNHHQNSNYRLFLSGELVRLLVQQQERLFFLEDGRHFHGFVTQPAGQQAGGQS